MKWNQAIIEDREIRTQLSRGVVIFATIDSDGVMQPIGSGFVIQAGGNHAVVLTAAHNLSGIHSLQLPQARNHPSALAEFIPAPKALEVDRFKVRAICFEGDTVEVAVIESAAYDEQADVAVVKIRSQDNSSTFFESAYLVDATVPKVGDEVAVLGRAMFTVDDKVVDGPLRSQKIGFNLFLRRGYVKEVYPDGHLLCRGPCLETTIPVFGGMSGGPVMRLGADGQRMMPFGIVSSDAEGETDKNDPSVAGSLIVALLPIKAKPLPNGQQELEFALTNAQVVHNAEWQ